MTHDNLGGSYPPGVMVSSTFYDLRQIREDLRRFLQDEIGHRPLLSEHPSFPIDPDTTAIDNCRQRVEHDADVLVLVIGRRYGSIDAATENSVTNLEYLAARHKGIPIYAFVESGLLAVLSVWRANPSADFSGEVDTPKLFDFIDQVRGVDGTWTQEFKHAQDIIDALRIQLAYQQRRGLHLQRRLRGAGGHDWMGDLRGETLRIALELPPAWEYRFFANALIDAVRRQHRLRRRHRLNVTVGSGDDVRDPIAWLNARFREARRFIETLDRLFGDTVQRGLGPPGQPGDAETLWFVAETVGEIYRDVLTWSSRLRTANVDERFERATLIAGRMCDLVIEQIEAYGPQLKAKLEEALATPEPSEPRVIEAELVLTMPEGVLEEFENEMSRLERESENQ